MPKSTDHHNADASKSARPPHNTPDDAASLYRSNEYVAKHPTLFAEHSAWKMTKLQPLLNIWCKRLPQSHEPISVLDVGGGAGLILKAVGQYITDNCDRQVRKYALDLSPAMLQAQRQTNPDLIKTLQQDITDTTFASKTIDLTLMIDVLEHVPDPVAALHEASRISNYILLKVPLEDHLINRLSNFLNRGRTRQVHRQSLGHVNFYTAQTLRCQLQKHLGKIISFEFTNAFEFTHSIGQVEPAKALQLANWLCRGIYRLSPRAASWLFTDFAVVLVHCRHKQKP